MTTELIVAAVVAFLAVVGGTAGWFGREQYGAEHERRKQAEVNEDALKKQAQAHAEPYMAPSVRASRLRRAAARLRALRDRAAGR